MLAILQIMYKNDPFCTTQILQYQMERHWKYFKALEVLLYIELLYVDLIHFYNYFSFISKQIKICEREAERITNLINSRSPLISTNYYLSFARAAFIIYPSNKSRNGAKKRLPALSLIPCTWFVVYILTK